MVRLQRTVKGGCCKLLLPLAKAQGLKPGGAPIALGQLFSTQPAAEALSGGFLPCAILNLTSQTVEICGVRLPLKYYYDLSRLQDLNLVGRLLFLDSCFAIGAQERFSTLSHRAAVLPIPLDTVVASVQSVAFQLWVFAAPCLGHSSYA